MTIQESIKDEAIARAAEVAKIFGVEDFEIVVDVFNVRSGKFNFKFDSTSSGSNMAVSNVINAAAIVGIKEECNWHNVCCDFNISVTVR